MDCWEILEIDETMDKNKVKSAYAKKLKVTRPDETPHEFQELNKAYKLALNLIANAMYEQAQQSAVSHESSIKTDTANDRDEEGYEKEQLSPEEVSRNTKLTNEFERLKLKVEGILSDKNVLNNTSTWQFLLQSEYILEHEFNFHFGLVLLESIYKHNKEFTIKKKIRGKVYTDTSGVIKDRVIVHLDGIFNWRSQINQVYYYLDEDIANFVLQLDIATDTSTNIDVALSSVKGGVVSASTNRQKDELSEYYSASDSLYNATRLFFGLALLLGVGVTISLYQAITKGSYLSSVAVSIGFISVCLIFHGLKRQLKIAHRLAWIIVVPMMFAFPFGTIWGGMVAINLYRSHSISSLK